MNLLEDYQQFVETICSDSSKASQRDLFTTCGLGLNEEAGEIAGILKKHFYHGHDFQHEHFVKELGDVLWYATLGAIAAEVSLQEVIETNMEKLRSRYKGGTFTTEESLNRNHDDVLSDR